MCNRKNGLILVVLSAFVTGCTMDTFYEAREGREKAEQRIADAPNWEESAAVYSTAPPPSLKAIPEPDGPQWLQKPVPDTVQMANMPFDMAVEAVLKGTGVVPKFAYDTDPGLKVSMNHTGSIKGALEKLSARTNYGYDTTTNTVEWHAYVTRTWSLPIAGGDYSFMIGKEESDGNNEQSSGGQDSSDLFSVGASQFSKVEGENLNHFVDAERTINQIVGDYGVVSSSQSSSTLVVKTTPDRMRTVSAYMESIMNELTTQVLLDLKVVQVTTESGADVGIDWSEVKETTSAQLNFFGETAEQLFTDSTPIGFSGTYESSNGSVDVLVEALEEQGDVSFITEQQVLSRSGKMAELELTNIKGYLASSEVTNTTDVGSSQELEQGVVQSGYTLYSYSKVFGDKVAVVISNKQSDLAPFERAGTEQNFIQLPEMDSNLLNVQQIIRNGTTVVGASVRRQETNSKTGSPVNAAYMPSNAGAETRTTDILVLVTPKIIRDI